MAGDRSHAVFEKIGQNPSIALPVSPKGWVGVWLAWVPGRSSRLAEGLVVGSFAVG